MSKRIFLFAIVLLLAMSVVSVSAQTTTTIELIPANQPLQLDAAINEKTHWDEVWDLTQGDVTMIFTLDMTGIIQPASWPTGWVQDSNGGWFFDTTPTTDPTKYPDTYTPWVEVGMRGVGGDDYNPGPPNTYQGKCGGWLVAESDDWLGARDENGVLINDGQDTQDGDDKLSLAATSGVGEWHYDVLDGDGIYGYDPAWNTVISDPAWEQAYPSSYYGKTVPGFGNHWNHGLWYDRDGVDPWQANAWGNSGENSGRINTGGIYHVEITYHAIDNGMGVMFATINGVKQGFFQADPVTGAINWSAPPTLYPAGLSFKGDMKQMQVFAGILAYDPAGFDYGSVELSNMQVTGIPGVANPLVPAFTATVGAGNVVTFDASATAGGMGPYTYIWDWNDGSVVETTSTPVVSHTFAGPGVYNVKLTVDPYRCKAYSVSQEVNTVPPKANLAIVKSGPVWGLVGDNLTYTYDVTNAGPASAAPTLTDDKCGVPTYVGGDANSDGLVNPGETWQFTCTYKPAVTSYMTLTNTATVMPVGVEDSDLSDNTDTYTLVWAVLRKDVLLYWQGHNVGYSDPNMAFTFEMWKDGVLLGTFTIKESAPVYFWMSEGTYNFYEVDVPAGYEPARASWWWQIAPGAHIDMSLENLIHFDMAVDKSCVESAAPGETITYGYTVTNTGPATVTPVLTDDKTGAPVYVSGDADGDGKIDPGEIWLYTADYLVPADAVIGEPIVNIATVKDLEDDYGDGWKLGGDTNIANNTDSCSVMIELANADLTVTKTAAPSFTRTFAWEISKAADKLLVRQVGGSAVFNYTVVAKQTGFTDSAWQVTGQITVTNPNAVDFDGVDVTDAIDNGGACVVEDGEDVTVPAGGSAVLGYTCAYAAAPTDYSGANTATATWPAGYGTPTTSATAVMTADFNSVAPAEVDKTITVTDTFNGATTTLGTLTAEVEEPWATKTFTYPRTIPVPAFDCKAYPNTAKIVETGQTAQQTVQVCGPRNLGGKTIGYWQNKNGQNLIKAAGEVSNVCKLTDFLRTYAPFQDLSATANCKTVATYVTNVIKAANSSGASMNKMLKAQMLATALSVYFTPSLGTQLVDLTYIKAGGYMNVSAAFGATSLTVNQMLAYAASISNVGGTDWYGQVKATQEMAKNAFDAINNNWTFAPLT